MLTILEVPKPMQFDVETTTEVPGASPFKNQTMELDIATARPAPDLLAFGPSAGTSATNDDDDDENQTMELDIAAARPAPDPLAFGSPILSTGTPENQTMGLDDAAARPAQDPVVTSAGPSEKPIDSEPDTLTIPATLNDHVIEPSQNLTISTDLVSPPQDLPVTTPPSQSMKPLRFVFGLAQPTKAQVEVQHTSPRRTEWLDRQKNRPKRRHDHHTNVNKTRLMTQDVLTTRVALQEKDRLIELLTNEVSGRLSMIEKTNVRLL